MTPPSPLQKTPAPEAQTIAGAGLELESPESGIASKVVRAAGSPLVRGGLTIVAGIVTGNILGFFRVALTAYFLGTRSAADTLAVAISPIDTLNQALINTIIFAFVPMLTKRSGRDRIALLERINRLFTRFFLFLTAVILLLAPQLAPLLAPGLPSAYLPQAIAILRIGSLSILAVGVAAVRSALLYTDRRFAPSAFHQATLNVLTIAGAVILWRPLGVYGFAIGYVAGAWTQFALVYLASRSDLAVTPSQADYADWRSIVWKPASILVYSGFIALNVAVTRAYATHVGPGAAAALDYCLRCIGVPLTFLVSPMSNSLLPEIARLRSLFRLKEAFRLIDRTLALAGLTAVSACAVGIAIRQPVITLLFERGSFTPDSTRLVSAVFLGFAPSLIGWSLLDLTARSLFALDRSWLPVAASAVPVVFNVALLLAMRNPQPRFIGLGASLGFLCAFGLLLALAHARRAKWLVE
jgi:putative peptidoglycan lipid II flippase